MSIICIDGHWEGWRREWFRDWQLLNQGGAMVDSIARPPCLTSETWQFSVSHLCKWALRVVESCVFSAAHHDTIGDMMATSSHVISSISRGGTQGIVWRWAICCFCKNKSGLMKASPSTPPQGFVLSRILFPSWQSPGNLHSLDFIELSGREEIGWVWGEEDVFYLFLQKQK